MIFFKFKLIQKKLLLSFLFVSVLSLTACTKREFTITSVPIGANCEVNGRKLGKTPVTVKYAENGTFQIHLSKEGFDNYDGKFKLKRKWFNIIGLDFFAEVLPYRFTDEQTIEFSLLSENKITHEQFKSKVDEIRNQKTNTEK